MMMWSELRLAWALIGSIGLLILSTLEILGALGLTEPAAMPHWWMAAIYVALAHAAVMWARWPTVRPKSQRS